MYLKRLVANPYATVGMHIKVQLNSGIDLDIGQYEFYYVTLYRVEPGKLWRYIRQIFFV